MQPIKAQELSIHIAAQIILHAEQNPNDSLAWSYGDGYTAAKIKLLHEIIELVGLSVVDLE